MGKKIPPDVIKAYAHIYGVCERAIKRAGGCISAKEQDFCEGNPSIGVPLVIQKALCMQALDTLDGKLISHYLKDVPGDFDDLSNTWLGPKNREIFAREKTRFHDMTPLEAANELRISKQRVGEIIKEGNLDGIKLGGRYYVASYSVHRRATYMRVPTE